MVPYQPHYLYHTAINILHLMHGGTLLTMIIDIGCKEKNASDFFVINIMKNM